jgi:hypothetical protein
MSVQEDLLAIELGQTSARSYGLTAQPDSNGTILYVSWKGIPNRNPSTSGDFVALWQNSGSLPWGTAALNSQNVTNTTPDGDVAFTGLSLTTLPYVVAYSVGADSTDFYNVAAVLPVSVGGSGSALQNISVSVGYVGATSLVIDYNTPIGVMPKTFGHTISLVKGTTYNPASASPIGSATPSDLSNDGAAFNNVTMVTGQYYTAAYLTGMDATTKQPAPASVAATVTFQVGQKS